MTSTASPAYVALGDSISIDDYSGGPGRGGPSLLFRNRDDDFPQWRGRDLSTEQPATAFHLLATDGATTTTLLGHQLPRLEAMGVRPTLVTLTIGGNDVLSTYGSTSAAHRVIGEVETAVGRGAAAQASSRATATRTSRSGAAATSPRCTPTGASSCWPPTERPPAP